MSPLAPVLATAAESAPLADVLTAPVGTPVDFAWLIPVIPALSAAVLLVLGKRIGRASSAVAIIACGASATIATAVFAYLVAQPETGRVFVRTLGTFIDAGPLQVDWALLIDPLSSIMTLLVSWVGLLIHIYSLGYMEHDERYVRFFAYLNLFVAAMLVLVLGESLLTVFVGWEGVGLASYLLIGFWFESRDNAAAAKKAFITNRVGDVGFMVAMFVVFGAFGTLSFPEILPEAGTVLATGTATAIALLLFLAVCGKSAQIPLYTWLPDAMAGPTPVSALIHAATMVTAGVFLVARTSAIYALVPDVGLLIAYVGAATALVAALIACAQTDLKRILAYSTVSQLGYMVIAVGVGDSTAGIFHLLTHGFFKALLFLAAGSVMHAMANRTDVRAMGGLWRVMPVTFWTSAIAVAAISGFPFTSGFFSKEEILASAAATAGAQLVWVIGIVTAALTAFYMTRWLYLVFLGPKRWPDGVHPHESPLSMTLPLGVLAVGALGGGLLNLTPEGGFLHGWLAPSVALTERGEEFLPATVLTVVAILVALGGIVVAVLAYRRWDPAHVGEAGGAQRAAREAFRVDALYEFGTVRGGGALSAGLAWFDAHVVDGLVNGTASATRGFAGTGRKLQTGFVRSYALAVLGGAVLVTALLLSVYVSSIA